MRKSIQNAYIYCMSCHEWVKKYFFFINLFQILMLMMLMMIIAIFYLPQARLNLVNGWNFTWNAFGNCWMRQKTDDSICFPLHHHFFVLSFFFSLFISDNWIILKKMENKLLLSSDFDHKRIEKKPFHHLNWKFFFFLIIMLFCSLHYKLGIKVHLPFLKEDIRWLRNSRILKLKWERRK